MYWDIHDILPYNRLYNFVVGARGCGKTYSFKEWAIKDYLKKGAQFAYVRRYQTEMEHIKHFWSDIESKFPSHEFKVDGNELIIDGSAAGYAIALTTSAKLKSTPFPLVNKICFDEFIISGASHYIKDEVTQWLELYNTIARSRDVRAFFISNALSVFNPYFVYFDIELSKKGIQTKGDILIDYIESQEYTDMVLETRFAKMLAGSEYIDYAASNNFVFDSNFFIKKKTGTAKPVFSLVIGKQTIGVWYDAKECLVYLSKDYDPSSSLKFCIFNEDHRPDLQYFTRTGPIKDYLIPQYKRGGVRFENQVIKGYFQQILKQMI